MHTIMEVGTSVPAFLGKLWKLVEDPETDDLICWSPNGRSFFIRNQAQFARELLPHYYKHNNMASFVRQLNMYGFHKKVSVELGGLKCDKDEMEFAHQYFCKGHPCLLEHIKRKIASNKGQDPSHTPIKPELMNKMLTEVRFMRGRQEHLDSRLGAMKRENEALWRELAMLRQKHLKQQEIVNKLIHFLVAFVPHPRGSGLSVKRRYPLMIDDLNRQHSKESKLSKSQVSPTGPVIHELDPSEHNMDSEYIVAEMLENNNSPAIQSPEHRDVSVIGDDNMETIQLVDNAIQLPSGVQLITPQTIDLKKKRGCKGKKRKNKVPVKILIPSTEDGEEPREETLMLEVPPEETPVTVVPLKNKAASSKPVPVATMRSSKLAAMAANMNKANDPELDLGSSDEVEEDSNQESDPALVKLEDILVIPNSVDDDDDDDDDDGGVNSNNGEDGNNDGTRDRGEGNNDVPNSKNADDAKDENDSFGNAVEALMLEKAMESNGASTSANDIDLSLSCVNPSGMTDAAYRLGPMEDMDNHLESMQSELDNLRDILRGEGYSIDANTLLGLFGADDPMSFAVPMNPELNPHTHREKEDEDHTGESLTGAGGGELMAYSRTPSLLDFDDDIFLGATTSSPATDADTNTNTIYNTDSLDLEDSKASLLESLAAANGVSPPSS